jgi:hypothetical protein
MQNRMAWVCLLTSMGWWAAGSRIAAVNGAEGTASNPAMPDDAFVVVHNFRVAGASSVKYPKVAFGQGRILLAGTSGEDQQARLWSKAPDGTAFGQPEVLGAGASNPDYSTSDVFVAADGTIYFASVDQATETLWMRRKPVGQDWEAARLVVDGAFRVYPQIMASPDGRIFVVWSEAGKFRYRTSIDGGVTWSDTGVVSNRAIMNHPSLASGPSGTCLALATNTGEIHLATWNGSGFVTERVSPPRDGERYFDPTISIGTNGTTFVAWRDVQNGIYLAERPRNGSWAVERIADGSAWRWISVSADSRGNVHVAWAGNAQPAGGLGAFHLIYQMRWPDRSWSAPIHFSNDGRFVANAQGAVFVTDRPYFLAAYEEHNPRDTRFVMVAAPTVKPPPPPPPPRSPQGVLDGITATGLASGWVFDPDAPNVSVAVHFYVDGPAGSGRFAGAVAANLDRPDVNAALGITGLHGFNFQIPASFRDGRVHTLFAHGIDTEGVAENRLLAQSGLRFILPAPRSPQGVLDGITAIGIASGWAFDPDSPNASVAVHFYVDGPAGSGTFAGAVLASLDRPDVNAAFGITGLHGFNFAIPARFRDGRIHTLFAHGIDSDGVAVNRLLAQSGMRFALRDQAPIGYVDGIADGHAGGWALDRDAASLSVRVQFFVDGPAGQGRFAGETRANIARPDVNRALGVAGDHGYSFRIPSEFLDGNPHRLFVYALDVGDSGNNAELSQSRMAFR